jgi:hypothetical protein
MDTKPDVLARPSKTTKTSEPIVGPSTSPLDSSPGPSPYQDPEEEEAIPPINDSNW